MPHAATAVLGSASYVVRPHGENIDRMQPAASMREHAPGVLSACRMELGSCVALTW